MKQKICRFFFALMSIFFLILPTGCNRVEEEEEIDNLNTEEQLNTEAFLLGEKEGNSMEEKASYGVPLEEIGEKLAYMYQYENMIFGIGDTKFDVLGELPEGEAVPIHIYLQQEENRILFLPDEMVNSRIGKTYSLHYEKNEDEYYFFTFDNRFVSEEGVPVIAPDSGIGPSIQVFRTKEADGIVKLGKVEVDFIKDEITLVPVEVEHNEYIEALIREVSKVLRESEYYGTYELYIESFGRVEGRYDDYTQAKITAVLVGEGLEQYIYATLSDGEGGIECHFPFLSFTREPTENFFTVNGYFSVCGYQSTIRDLLDLGLRIGRGKVAFEVTPETGEEEVLIENQAEEREVYDHRQIQLEEALDYIEYACSYTEWFGMYELGYREGSVRNWDGIEIAVYTTKDKILIIPTEQTKEYTFVVSGEEREYPLAKEEEHGSPYFTFYYLKKNPYATESGQLKSTLVTNDWNSVAREMFYLDDVIYDLNAGEMKYLGKGTLNIPELADMEIEAIEQDEYVIALEEHIKAKLKAEGITGEYTLMIGEYEAFSKNQVCISAAVFGEKEYYLRFFIYQSKTGHFYFWPVGFGVDGRLSEGEAEAYHMNRVCIDRTMELNRYRSSFQLSTEVSYRP